MVVVLNVGFVLDGSVKLSGSTLIVSVSKSVPKASGTVVIALPS
jgi:hypothetical protein